jgi:NAD(P)H-flavin reductase
MFSTSEPRRRSTSLVGQNPRGKKSRGPARNAILTASGVALLAAGWYGLSSNGGDDESLNTNRFSAFDITSKEQVSPTAFIMTIRCQDKMIPKNLGKLEAAWEHGLWSVEMKQPQLQIARHYTPLPPLDATQEANGELRFLIRKMDSGEMSNYLSRLQVGDQVWLRGPHYGFDVSKRLGEAQNVVFLAGGTGIAPALQLAHKVLDGASNEVGSDRPTVRILWANRRNIDSVGRGELSAKATKAANAGPPSTLSRQLLNMKQQYGDHFNIDYYVDDEKRIALKDIDTAMGKPLSSRRPPVLAPADKSCRWHFHDRLAELSDEDDAKEIAGPNCTCRAHKMPPEAIGRNLVCVSGPEGFIEAYAGSKRWFGGREIQGPVQGLLGAMKKLDPSMDDWLVLKL